MRSNEIDIDSDLALTALSFGSFHRLLAEERVVLTTENLPFAGHIVSELQVSKQTFQKLHSSYCRFLSLFKQANLAAKPERRAAFARANQVFDDVLVPELQEAGIFVDRSPIKTTSAFYHLQDLPLNSDFEWMGATVDLNTAAGIRSLSGSNDSSITNTEGRSRMEVLITSFAQSMLALPQMASLLTAPPTQQLTIEQRCMVFISAALAQNLQYICNQQIIASLYQGQSVKVPVQLRLFLPAGTVSLSGRARALIYFEEVAHLFQFLNEGPLTVTGDALARELAEGNMYLRACAQALGFRGDKLIVLENDLVGVLYELGIKPPASFLNRPYEYQRRTISDLFFYDQ
jgi:hypothetical protein